MLIVMKFGDVCAAVYNNIGTQNVILLVLLVD